MINEKNTTTSGAAGGSNSANDSTTQHIKSTGNSADNKSNNKSGSDQPVKSDTGNGPVGNILAQAKDSAGEIYGMAAGKATSQIEGQKKNLSSGLTAIADSIRQAGQSLRDGEEQSAMTGLTADYGQTIADKIEQVSGYFDRKDLKGIVRDVEGFARSQPVLFIGAAFTLGLLAARFMKSSSVGPQYADEELSRKNAPAKSGKSKAANSQKAMSPA